MATDKYIIEFEVKDAELRDTLKRVNSQLDDLNDTVKNSNSRFSSLNKTITLAVGAFAGFQIVNKAKNFLVEATKAASDAGESINAVNVVFDEGAEKILKFSEIAAREVGLSANAFRQLSTQTGALLSTTGLNMDEVAEQTIILTKRAADLASVYNTSVDDALSAINQALRGETEAIRRYSGDVTDASLQAFLLSKNINKSTSELSENEKRLYRVQLLLEQTAMVQGDFANTSDQAANKTRILTAVLENKKTEIGQRLLPVWNALLDRLAVILPVVLDGVIVALDFIIQKSGEVSRFLAENWDIVEPVLIGFAVAIGAVLVPAFIAWAVSAGAAAVATLASVAPILLVVGVITVLAAAIIYAINYFQLWDDILKIITKTFNLLKNVLYTVNDATRTVGDTIVNTFNTIGGVIERVINKVAFFINKIRELVAYVNNIKISIPSIPNIPGFASGTNFAPPGLALVGERGPELVQFRGGEKVIPNVSTNNLNNSNNQIVINNYNNGQMDESVLAQKLAFLLL